MCNFRDVSVLTRFGSFFLGDNSLAPVLSTICGRELPGPIRSTGDAMFIQFTSDASITGAGFNASYHKSMFFFNYLYLL